MGGSIDSTKLGAVPLRLVNVRFDAHRHDVHVCAAFFDDGRRADGERPCGYFEAVQHHGIRGNDLAGSYDDLVKNDGAIRHLRPVFDGATFEVGNVPDDALVANDRWVHRRRVEHRAVLN